MNQTIQIKKLMELLRNAEDESSRFNNPLAGFDEGVLYLYEKVFLPLLHDVEVNTSDLDMDQFDREDIATIFDFYYDNYTSHSKELSHLSNWYNTCWNAPAVCQQTAFL